MAYPFPSTPSSPALPLNQSPPQSPPQPPPRSTWLTLVTTLGLPCIIGVAAIDPGNLEVDLQAGATFGYALIWALLLASILGWILQTLAAHVTIYTDLHLAELCHRVYRRTPILSRMVFLTNLVSVVAFDVAEVIGTAVATRLLFGIPLSVGMVLSVCDTLLVLHLQRNGMTRIEIIVEGLLFILAACLFYEFVLAGPSWPSILHGAFIPSFGSRHRPGGVLLAISIMGSVIMSHNLFLHSWLEKDRRKSTIQSDVQTALISQQHSASVSTLSADSDEQRQQISNHSRDPVSPMPPPPPPTMPASISKLFSDCRYAAVESGAIFFSTFLINMCVLVVAASLPQSVLNTIDGEIGLKDAGALLQRVLGQRFTSTAWGIALLASGHAATVTGVLASQAVCEGFLQVNENGDSNGLGVSPSHIILGSRLIAILPALVVALVAGEEGSDSLAVASQAMLSFSLPFAAIPLFKVLEAVAMFRPLYSRVLLIAGYVVFSVVMLANVMAIRDFAQVVSRSGSLALGAFWLLTAVLSAFLVKLIFTPIQASDISTDFRSEFESNELSSLLPNK